MSYIKSTFLRFLCAAKIIPFRRFDNLRTIGVFAVFISAHSKDKNIHDSNDGLYDKSGFCGISIGSKCNSDKDCMTSGCSSQVCQGRNEEPLATICDMRDCYVASNYGVECGCVDSECQWN